MDEQLHLANAYLAYQFKDTVSNAAAIGALECAHNVLLECFVAPLHYLDQRIRPTVPLDTLALFKAVARTFETFQHIEPEVASDRIERVQFVRWAEAVKLIESSTSRQARSILRHFVRVFARMMLPQDTRIDIEFCCKLVGAFVAHDDVVQCIFSGALARELAKIKDNPDHWVEDAWNASFNASKDG